ncbi:hypothetical protein HDA32_004432 [Spinactinospora alkalitolerans]|uniref:Uncharacterized protein n=1 Tax=Spinactinospora alkalitolerans TaxID=687207 RepID=A0A852U1R9_9ACTN|nr:hypothetical protein [Spinactinospora alkalitolerans]NYE49312.1 hypothetical protein [Spinactinospora alkalitolerans]
MRLVFTNAAEEAFDAYRERFVARAVDHARRERTEVSRLALEEVLDYKYGEPDAGGDGLVARWHAADVASLLLDWIPRAGGKPPAFEEVSTALRTWWALLSEEGWLDPRSDAPDALAAAIEEFADGHRYAMEHPAEHRIAAFMQRTMAEFGVDVSDPEQVAEFEARVDSGEIPMDLDLLADIAAGDVAPPPSLLAGPGRYGYTWRAPRLPEGEELAAAIERAPAIADERAAAPEERKDPEELWLEAYDGVPERLAARLGLEDEACYEAFGAEPDTLLEFVVTALFMERLALPASLITEITAAMGDLFEEDRPLTESESRRFGEAVAFLLDELERLGAVERETSGEDARRAGEPVIRLTALGEWAGFEELSVAGYAIRTFDELMGENAEVLVERAATGEPFTDADLDSWIAERDTAQAMRELIEVARRTDDCTHRAAVRAATAEHALVARPFYEGLRDHPDFGGQARSWLHNAGFAKDDEVTHEDLAWTMIDGIAAMARLDLMTDEQIADLPMRKSADGMPFLDIAVALDHPETGYLLGWIGENHPDAKIRKQARTTLFRHSSRTRENG